jgi:hypothetical protein
MSHEVEPCVRVSVQATWTLPAFAARLGWPWKTARLSSFTFTLAAKDEPPFVDRVAKMSGEVFVMRLSCHAT